MKEVYGTAARKCAREADIHKIQHEDTTAHTGITFTIKGPLTPLVPMMTAYPFL